MVLIAIFEVPGMLRNRHYRTLVVFSGLWLIAGVYASLFISRFPLPDVTAFLIELIQTTW